MMVFDGFLDPILNPLLTSFGQLGFVALISLIVSLITVIVYKYTTDQILMKSIKEDLDKLNKKMKEHKSDSHKMIQVQKEMWSKQMTMMKHSFTSTIYTFLPIIILFNWLRLNLNSDKILNLGVINFGWLGSYIIFAILFSSILRKILKVY
ncbi:MAG: EMC3/TMCO1 family protein [Nanoarchaeota archaeon]